MRGVGHHRRGYMPAEVVLSWRSATVPATPLRCCCSAACRWCRSRFRWACASSSRRRRSIACKYGPTPLEAQARRGRLQPGGQRAARSVHFLHVRRRPHHSERVGGGLLLHQRHEPVEARFAVRQQRPGRDGSGRGISAAATCWPACGCSRSTKAEPSSWAAASIAVRSSGPRDFLGRANDARCPGVAVIRAVWCCADMAELVPPLIVEALHHGLPIMDRRWHGRFLTEAIAGRPGSARQLAGAHRARRSRPRNRRASPDCIRSAKGPATRAASSAPRWTGCARQWR